MGSRSFPEKHQARRSGLECRPGTPRSKSFILSLIPRTEDFTLTALHYESRYRLSIISHSTNWSSINSRVMYTRSGVSDFVMDEKRTMAVKTIDIRDRVRDYMERWAWRMTDLRNENPGIVRAMIYNPDEQNWDDTSLAIGREVCDMFCPYFDNDHISAILDSLKTA